jgi:hypothetical protein
MKSREDAIAIYELVGRMNIRAVVVGQSHCVAIGQALTNPARRVDGIAVYRIAKAETVSDCVAISSREAAELAAGLAPGIPVFLSVLGGYHNPMGLLRSERAYDFLLDADDRLDPDAMVVPHRALASMFKQVFDESEQVRRIVEAAVSPVYLLSTPPPKECNLFIMERLGRLKKKILDGRNILEAGVERPETRLKLWMLETRLLAEWARAAGMRFVSAPPAAIDRGGYLDRQFYHDDVTHANEQYGALVLGQISEILVSRADRVHRRAPRRAPVTP